MLYLEDYLEMIEHLPQELRDRFTEMREMDLQVQNSMDSLEDRIRQLFGNAKKVKTEQRDVEYDKIRQDYYKSLEDADEKVHMANQMYDLVDKYLRRLDQELQKFKMELEADNAGITEILEKRSLELDNPPPALVPTINHHPKSEKRKYTSQSSYSAANGSDKKAEKSLNAYAAEVLQEPVKFRSQSSISYPSASTSPFSSNHDSPVAMAATTSTTTTTTPQPSLSYNLGHMGAGGNAIAAAASQAIAATQQMQQGRRTASLKASFQVVNSGLSPSFNNELTLGRDAGSRSSTGIVVSGSTANSTVATVNATGLVGNSSSSSSSSVSAVASAASLGAVAGGGGGGASVQGTVSANFVCGNATSISPVPEVKSGRQKKQSKSSNVVVVPVEPPVLSPEDCQGANLVEDSGQGVDWTYDPNEPRYCICNQVSYGDMVACDNEDCPVEWFHYNCVGITQPPRGKWYCPQCTTAMRRRGRKER